MGKLIFKMIKDISNCNISIKKNYKIFRVLQEVMNPSFLNKKNYYDTVFCLDDREIKVRIFWPSSDLKPSKLIIFVHGGGWVTGSIQSYTNTCIELAKKTNRMVMAIDYRLAPEYPYPAGFDDCYDVTKIIMQNLEEMGLNKEDVCLMGDSAGGNLVAAISLKSRRTKDFKVFYQILLYPALQSDYSINTKYKSVIENGEDYLLTRHQLEEYMSLYVTDPKDLKSPYVAPLNAKNLFFQPKTLIITSNLDPLRDEGKRYYIRLKRYFNCVKYYNFDNAMHGFLSQPLEKKHTMQAYNKIVDFLGDEHEKNRKEMV